MTTRSTGSFDASVGWWRGIVIIGSLTTILGAIGWWSESDYSVGYDIILVIPVVISVVPIAVLNKVNFRYACYICGSLLLLNSFLLFFLMLVWSFTDGIILLLIGFAERSQKALLSKILASLALTIAIIFFALFLYADIKLLMQHQI